MYVQIWVEKRKNKLTKLASLFPALSQPLLGSVLATIYLVFS